MLSILYKEYIYSKIRLQERYVKREETSENNDQSKVFIHSTLFTSDNIQKN